MTQRSMFWDLEGGGDAVVYNQSHLMDRFFRAILNGTGNRGVIKGWRNELEVTGTTSPLSVGSGGAIVYGMFYDNDSGSQVGIPTPSVGTQTYYIVIRRSWAGQTCRINRVSPVWAPSGDVFTQTAGTTWDIPLALVEVGTSGECTVTDARDWATFSTAWPGNLVQPRHFAEGAVTAEKIADRTRWQTAGAGELEENTGSIYLAAEWVGSGGLYGSAYDYWQFPDWSTPSIVARFIVPPGVTQIDLHVWNVPDVNAAAGAQNVHWDHYMKRNTVGEDFVDLDDGATLVDQALRLAGSIYRDTLASAVAVIEGHLIDVRVDRAGIQADDTFGSPVRVLALEISYTADC